MTEEWRPVVGYEGLYEVSDAGRVRSLARLVATKDINGVWRQRRVRPRILKLHNHSTGYQFVTLYLDGLHTARRVKVHHVVLEAFRGPRPPGMHSCHSNDIRSDNRSENLRWDTPSANVRDAVNNGRNINANKTHCKRGHEFTSANTYVIPTTGSRQCRACVAERHAA